MKFIPRKNAPSSTNKFYLKAGKGGYNRAAEINKTTHSCLPNCCGLSYTEDGWKVSNRLIIQNMTNYV